MATLALAGILNTLAGTTGLEATGAANAFAAYPNPPQELLGALNIANGSVGLGLDLVCNQLAGTQQLSAIAALNSLIDGSGTDPVTNLVEALV